MRSTKKQPEDSIDDKIKDITRNGEVKRGAPNAKKDTHAGRRLRMQVGREHAGTPQRERSSGGVQPVSGVRRPVGPPPVGLPVRHTSYNAPSSRAVLTTAISGILEGASRYRHFNRLSDEGFRRNCSACAKFMSCDFACPRMAWHARGSGPCHRHVLAMPSPCRCHAIAMSVSCQRHARTMPGATRSFNASGSLEALGFWRFWKLWNRIF